MNDNASVAKSNRRGHYRLPIVEQYGAIRKRQREIASAEGKESGRTANAAGAAAQNYVILVRHAGRTWFLSWLLPPDGAMLNPYPEAAMRFGSLAVAAALIENVLALRDKARADEVGIVGIGCEPKA
jgi:hypothetical protein